MQLTIEQAADRLGKSVRQVRGLIQSGVLHATKTGGRRLIAAAAASGAAPVKAPGGGRASTCPL